MVGDAAQRLRVTYRLDRALERILDRGLEERGVPAAGHAAHGLGHLPHARLVRSREQVRQLYEE